MHAMHASGGATSSNVASFLGMWILMMAAMMLPSLVPTLWRYRRRLELTSATRPNWLTAIVGTGYVTVWMIVGVVVYLLKSALESPLLELSLPARAIPVAIGAIVLSAGAVQFTAWKERQLVCCREAVTSGWVEPADIDASWRHGMELGWHCTLSCAGPMVTLLAIGMMDWRAMAIVTTAITLERLTPAYRLVACVTGVAGLVVGIVLLGRALG